jgi:hypothetical protein
MPDESSFIPGQGMAGDLLMGVAKKVAKVGMLPFAARTVFHGSPHKFDKFLKEKIGTGEGAQAYGHGLYFAEDPKVAGQYQKNLGNRFAEYKVSDGRTLKADDDIGIMLDAIANGKQSAEHWARLTPEEAKDPLMVKGAELAKTLIGKDLEMTVPVGGSLYHVNLPDSKIDKMLDWDKPLSEQPAHIEAIKKAFKQRGFDDTQIKGMLDKDITGEQAYKYIASMFGEDKASGMLSDLGIPGIRYLDQGSRTTGKGTRNFVVFDENDVKILERK